MKHLTIRWNRATNEWFCVKCGQTSFEADIDDARLELEQYQCLMPSVEVARATPGTETTRLMKRPFNMTLRAERSGSRFVVGNTNEGKPLVRLELFHNTVSRLETLTIDFEMLSGVTLEQARVLVDEMNARIVGVIVAPK